MVGTVTFNQAMLAKDRVFAIRAGTYTSSDIKEASFNYGYISGDTFKPGGTVAGSAKLIFTSIITTFNKLDKIYPEIGLLVGDSYEWVAMGEYFVNDISIDRNRNTTELDLMDGMFKLNQPYVSDLTYPAQIRDVIREICVKTGIELETDNLSLKAIQRHIEAKADKKDITFREVLSQAIQLLGFSAFFNRKGKLEVRGLTESRITVTADNYFLHGLTKSEIQYQIAGITCKKDKETLTVGLRTGRSLELENSFMNQNLLDELYYELKDIKYYPFSLDWQGHLKLDVGQWITLKTNKNETYKVPVLSQSFSFKGGLKSKISADSKARNDTQYSYKGFLTKQIEQMSTQIDAEIQQQLEYANAEFDRKTEEYKKELDDGIEQAKAEAEAYADTIRQELDAEIAQVNQSMQAQSEEHDRQVADILSKTQSVESLANQAKSDAASAIARANQVKSEAIADARAQVATVSQALNTAKSELQTAIASADQKARDSQASATALRSDLNLQASKILEQAQAQTALTSRVTTVETLADGTRSTVTELSKTVSKATGDIASVTSRAKIVEDTLSQTRAQYEALTQTVNTQTGQIDSINRKTADLQSGIDGVTERFENLRVGGRNLIPGSKTFTGAHWEKEGTWRLEEALYKEAGVLTWVSGNKVSPMANIAVDAGEVYTFSAYVKKESIGTVYFYLYDPTQSRFATANVARETRINNVGNNFQRFSISFTATRTGMLRPRFAIQNSDTGGFSVAGYQLERGSLPTDYNESTEDFRSEFATYVRNASENSAELVRRIETADGKAVEAKTYAQQTAEGFKTRLESLETYKNEEGTRASQYLTASREETARQLTAERTAIANDYVAKSTYDENVRGTTLKLDEIKTTADTAKQNLATYQNTVDRKLEELTSSAQTLDGKINTASSKVDTVAGQIRTEISEVEGKILTEIGGRNLFKGSRDFSGVWHNAGNGSFFEEYKGVHIHRTKNAWLGKSQRISVKSGEIYTFSFYAKSDSENDRIVFYLSHSSTGTPAQGHPNNKYIAISTDYQRYSITIKIVSDGIIVPRLEKTNTTGFLFFGGFKLETGAIPTDWTPAPEDLIDEISSVKTTITQTARGVEQLSTSLSATDNKVTTAEANIRNLVDEVSSKVSQTDYNTLTGRVENTETAITQNADEISKRLTSTQVESVITGKGYQTKSDVDSNITGRGYITNAALQPYALSTTVQTLVKETADSFSRTISETKALIPSNLGGTNLICGSKWLKRGSQGWSQGHWRSSGSGGNVEYNVPLPSSPIKGITTGAKITSDSSNQIGLCQDGTSLEAGTYTLSVWVLGSNSLKVHVSSACSQDTSNPYTAGNKFVTLQDSSWTLITQTFTLTKRYSNLTLAYLMLDSPGTVYYAAPYIHKSTLPGDWTPAPEDLATVTALHSVRDTVDSHTRTIGAVGETGSILDNVSKVTQTANGLVQEVTGEGGLKTQVSTLAGSWAVQNLTSAGEILNQFNLLADGTNRIDGRLTHITGQTLIDDAAITDAKIASLDAGKITSGYISAERLDAKSITAAKLKVDQAFFDALAANRLLVKDFFAKDAVVTSIQAVTLSATQIKSGILKAFNDRTTLDLSTGKLTFNNGSPSIEFNSDTSAIRRVTNGQSQFIKFASHLLGTQTTIGANRKANDESIGTADFTGIQIQSRAGGVLSLIDKIYVCADEFIVDGGGGQVDGFVFKNREALYPQSSGMLNLGRLGDRWNNVYAFNYYVGQNAVSLKEFLDAVRACFQQIAYGGMNQTTYDLMKTKLSSTFNKIQ
ncbi:TPA: gp58-like family protein [Streptococcus suis]